MEDRLKYLSYAYMIKNMKRRVEEYKKNGNLLHLRIAVLCGSTFGDISKYLELFLLSYDIAPVFFVGEYNRYYEEACFRNPELEKFNPDIIIIHTTIKNIEGHGEYADLSSLQSKFTRIWDNLKFYNSVIIQNNIEYPLYRYVGNISRVDEMGIVKLIDDMNGFISRYAHDTNNFYINDINYLSARVGLKEWYDSKIWTLYKYPMSLESSIKYSYSIANIIKSLYGRNCKVVVTDLDNTLWGGIIGEVGVDGIEIGNGAAKGELYYEVQSYLKSLKKCGILLGICSKNDYEIGLEGIHARKSLLNEEDFVSIKINWKDKSSNISEISEDINILDDHIVFLDDSNLELDSVRAFHPGVTAIDSANPTDMLEQLEELSLFEGNNSTNEDYLRMKYYQDNAIRNEMQLRYDNYDDYLQSLEMKCYFCSINTHNISRVHQLVNKTNQFNNSSTRYSLAEIENRSNERDYFSFVGELDDILGANGIVTVAWGKISSNRLIIECWVMSCRVFGRGLEMAMMKRLVEFAFDNELTSIVVDYKENGKNSKVKKMLMDLDFAVSEIKDSVMYSEWVCSDLDKLMDKCKNYIQVELRNE